jgi:diguanylate cyclase (GGDEF)-like protein/PAS domain S-box-containing protein
MNLLRDTVVPLEPIRETTDGSSLYERFKAEPDTLLVGVVDERARPVGLVERNSFFVKMASEYGRALYARRPISMIMDTSPLVVEGEARLDDFTAKALTDRPSDLLRGFIVVEDGIYSGVGTLLSLLKATNDENRRTAEQLFDLAQRLTLAKSEAEESKVFADAVIENIPAMVYVKAATDGKYLLLNRAGEEITGMTRQAVVGRTHHELLGPDAGKAIEVEDQRLIATGEVFVNDDDRIRRRDGATRLLRSRKLMVRDDRGAPKYILGVSEDVTEQALAAKRIAYLADHDALTGLANRARFARSGEDALVRDCKAGLCTAVLSINLDGFKAVNEAHGHAVGDNLLVAVAQRLRERAGDASFVAPLGGDEFAVLRTGVANPESVAALASAVVEDMSRSFQLDDVNVHVGAGVGIAISPTDGEDLDSLLQKAQLALDQVKNEGGRAFRFFEARMDEQQKARRVLEADLRQAIALGELVVHFQPLINLATEQVTGCEALVRWQHPMRGLVPPSDFIPLAEDVGLIAVIGEWVLRRACEEAASWPGGVRVAVNVSPSQLRDANFVATVMSALAESGLAPTRLELEITESVLMQDSEATIKLLHQLRSLGVRISMDDFGTGYSSLSYLRSFPFDKIKIDRCFVKDLPHAQDSNAIIGAVASLGASLGMVVTAEGVESEDQFHQLRALGCTELQGFFIGRPTAAEHIRARLGAPEEVREAKSATPIKTAKTRGAAKAAAVASVSEDQVSKAS